MEDAPAALHAATLAGRDDMAIYVSGNGERILLSALFDNLGKGASGAAVECFNLMRGLPSETGLVLG
jgi:N-acetyl-gamma-glutamyl-phosphate reductase